MTPNPSHTCSCTSNQYLRAGWIEALGDLAHYRKAVAAMVTGSQGPNPEELTTAGISTDLSHTQQYCGWRIRGGEYCGGGKGGW